MIGLFTSDIPAVPITNDDTIHVTFNVENNIGGNPNRYKVVDASFSGTDLTRAVNEDKTDSHSPIIVKCNSGEWQFSLQGTVYIIRSLVIYVEAAKLKKFVPDL